VAFSDLENAAKLIAHACARLKDDADLIP